MLRAAFGSLRVRNFRLFATGQLIKLIGTWMLFTAQDWLVLQLSHNSPTALGFVSALQFLPVLLLSLYGGQLADRYDKRTLLLISNAGSALVAGVLGFLVLSGLITIFCIFVTAALYGVIQALETPARQSFFSEMVDAELLPNALSLSAATFNGARTVGPAIAGLLVSAFDTGPVFLITAGMCIGPLIMIGQMRPAELHRNTTAPKAVKETRILDGLKYAWSRSDIAITIGLVLIVSLFGFNFQLTLAVLAKSTFHADASHFGLLSTSIAIGAFFGAMSGTRRKVRPSIYLVLVAAILFSAFEMVTGFAPSFVVAMLLLLPTGYFMIYFAQAANQRVQLGVDPEFRGRVMSLYVLVFIGSTPIGSLIIGWLSKELGPRAGLWFGGGVALLAGVAVLVMQRRRAPGEVTMHLKPTPHLHVIEPAFSDDSPPVELRVPKLRPAAR